MQSLIGCGPLQFAWVFNTPVDTSRFPTYLSVVSRPVDFGTMKARCEAGLYKEPSQVYADFKQVFDNAFAFNPPGSDVHYMATVLQVGALP